METNSIALHETIITAYDAGTIMVAASGNNYGGDCEYPAAYDEVIGVGALTERGVIAELSAIIGVDVWAPGTMILSTSKGGIYKMMSGTSMSTPHWCAYLIKEIWK